MAQIISVTSPNRNLKPETANTLTAGVVATPTILPGFAASFDYWDIKLKGSIGSVGTQETVEFCYVGYSQFCPNIVFSGPVPVNILRQPVNFASQHTKGFDIEASYRTQLAAISANLPGTQTIHATATHAIKSVVDNLVFPVDYAGVVGDGVWLGSAAAMPRWGYRVSTSFDVDPFSVNVVARGVSSGVYSNEWFECTSTCPTSTILSRTVNQNDVPGATYFDIATSVKMRSFGGETELSFVVHNVFNKNPALVGIDPYSSGVPNPQTVSPLYDPLGRVFRVAITSKF